MIQGSTHRHNSSVPDTSDERSRNVLRRRLISAFTALVAVAIGIVAPSIRSPAVANEVTLRRANLHRMSVDTGPKPRARDLGVPFDGTPGRYNAITDVAGVEVGQVTLISGSGPLVVGKGPVRTGVTAILPRGMQSDQTFANWATLNGNGEMTGTTWMEESGYLQGPVMITNTNSVGIVRDAVIEWQYKHLPNADWGLPVVAETWDGAGLNDGYGFHVTKENAFAAIEAARSGPVEEGNVGGGTGMVCHQFKGGIGTSSRVLSAKDGGYTVGVLVQCNYGSRQLLRIAGAPVGADIPEPMPCYQSTPPPKERGPGSCNNPRTSSAGVYQDVGSIIVVVGTDAPLLPHQLKAIAKRVTLALGRTGSLGGDSSGDIFVAFSTANSRDTGPGTTQTLTMLRNERLNPLFEATIQATEEAIVNALVAARTMVGANDLVVPALPHDRLRAVLAKYNRLAP
jgi:D-aminopeptidase